MIGDRAFHVMADEEQSGIAKIRRDRLLMGALDDIADAIAGQASRNAPLGRTGNLKRRGMGTVKAKHITPDTMVAEVGLHRDPPEGPIVHEGTGNIRIYPHGNVLAFRIRGLMVFARWVRGQRAQPFFNNAVLEVENSYVPIRLKILEERLRL